MKTNGYGFFIFCFVSICIMCVCLCAALLYHTFTPQPAQIDETATMQAQIDELTDANERLADMYIDIEAENKELRKMNDALIADNEVLAQQAEEKEVIHEVEYIETTNTEYVEIPTEETQEDEAIECGACGAHVHDWYYVRSMDGQDFVEVCNYCYEAMQN